MYQPPGLENDDELSGLESLQGCGVSNYTGGVSLILRPTLLAAHLSMQLDPVGSVVGLTGCFVDWILTRPWKYVILFFLPLVLAVTVGGLVVAGSWLNKDVLADRYLQLANAEVVNWESKWAPVDPAVDQEKSGTTSNLDPSPTKDDISSSAEMFFRRVQQLQHNDRRSMFFVAMSYLQKGALQQGMNMLTRIAPEDSIGYLPAHAFLAEYLLGRPIARKDIPVLRHHMLASLRWDRASPQLLATISQMLFNINENDAALDAMKKAAERDPNFYLPLAKLGRAQANPRLAEDSLNSAIKHFTAKLERNPQDANARLLLVDSYCQAENFVSAEKLLTEGIKLSDNPLFKTALSEVYCRTFISTSKFEGNTWSGDIELLEKAFRIDPNNLHIYEEVAKLARVGGSSPHEELMNQLRKNLAEGKATSVTHTWIAEHYLIHNEFAKAIPHLEQAVKRDPQASRCWNNLAYAVADIYPERLEDALKYSDQAVKIAPIVPDFHDTRGTVLMKLKRYPDAVAAYEQAIECVAQSRGRFLPVPAYHDRLAAAYIEAGDAAMAKTHQEISTQLTAQYEAAKQAAAAAQGNSTSPTGSVDNAAEPSTSETAAASDSQASTDAASNDAAKDTTNDPAASEVDKDSKPQ